MAATTIKVSAELRDRVNHDASERGLTAAELITVLIDDYERRQRFAAFGEAFARAIEQGRPDVEYGLETQDWLSVEPDWPHA